MNKHFATLIAVFAVAAIALIGRMDIQDAAGEQLVYCQNVRAHMWPDYHHDFAKACGQQREEKLKKIANIY